MITDLRNLIAYFNAKKAEDVKVIEIHWRNGEKSGISNIVAIQCILEAINQELVRQLKAYD